MSILDPSADPTPTPSRRQFLRGSVRSTWLLGLGWLGRGVSGDSLLAASSGGRRLGDEFTYDVSSLRRVDPKLILYRESGKLAPGLKELRAITLDSQDQLFAVGDRLLIGLDAEGKRTREIALSAPPRCLAVDGKGRLYIGFKDHLQIVEPGQTTTTPWTEPRANAVITSIAVTEKGIFVADAGNRVVLRYDASGKLEKEIGKRNPEKNVPGFIIPSAYFDLNVGPDGMLWVGNTGRHRLEAYTLDGDFELAWGEPSNSIQGFCGCCNPVHFARLPDGGFVTSEKGLTRVKIYSAKGEFEGVVAAPDQFPRHFDNPNASPVGIGVAVDSRGRILLADPLTGEVRIFVRNQKA